MFLENSQNIFTDDPGFYGFKTKAETGSQIWRKEEK